MDSDVGHLSPTGLLIPAPLSRWSRQAEQNLNCKLNPTPTLSIPEDMGTRWESQTASQASLPSLFLSSVIITSPLLSVQRGRGGEVEKHMCGGGKKHTYAHIQAAG